MLVSSEQIIVIMIIFVDVFVVEYINMVKVSSFHSTRLPLLYGLS